VDPTWEIGKLGAIVVVRTVLNHFLHREIEPEQRNMVSVSLSDLSWWELASLGPLPILVS
jgi:hypothetical protein